MICLCNCLMMNGPIHSSSKMLHSSLLEMKAIYPVGKKKRLIHSAYSVEVANHLIV